MKGQHDAFAATAEAARHRREVAAAVAAERARCAAVCREVAAQAAGPLALDAGVRRGALACADAIERGPVDDATLPGVG